MSADAISLGGVYDGWEGYQTSLGLAQQVPPTGSLVADPTRLVQWLETSWGKIAATLAAWNTDDLAKTYPHTYWGKTYAVSRQWTLWRILSHDIHHGGQLSLMLACQGISAPELCDATWAGI